MHNYTKPTLLAWFFFLGGIITTVSLGIWQVQRLEQKTALIARIEAAAQAKPSADIPRDDAALAALEFHRARLQGTWVEDTEFHVAARYFKGENGYHIFAPLALADGRTALVNRGWVPTKQKEIAMRPESVVRGKADVVAMVRIGADRNFFTPISQPEKNMWFGRDVAQMQKAAGLKNVIPATFDVVGAQDAKTLPVPFAGEIKLRNDHLSYIITWFGIALGMVIIFVLSHRKKARQDPLPLRGKGQGEGASP